MCGRFTLVAGQAEIHDRFQVEVGPKTPHLTPRYNIAPTQTVAVVANKRDPAKRGLALLKWGLVPHFANDPKPGPTNARAETVDTKPTFRECFRQRRCLLPMTGFYEWQTIGKQKVPHHFTLQGGGLMGVAGLWDIWRGGAESLVTCCLITTAANPTVRPVHDRMPVILPPELWADWLSPDTPVARLLPLLRPYPGDLDVHVASPLVNGAGNEGPDLLAA